MLNNHAKLSNIVPTFDNRAEAKAHVKIRKAFQSIRVAIVKDSAKASVAKAIRAIKGKPKLTFVCDDSRLPKTDYMLSIAVGMMIGGFGGMVICIASILFN